MPSMTHHHQNSHTRPRGEEVILGVDTHKDVHVAAVITVLGVGLASAEFATDSAGYRQLLAWARGFGVLHRAGVEGTGCYGAALTRHLRHHDITVVEVNRPDRAARRRHGKTDAVDAVAAAHAVLSGRANGTAKTGDGPVEMLRMFRLGPHVCGQGPHPGDQPAQSRHRRRRAGDCESPCPACPTPLLSDAAPACPTPRRPT
jgi:hypothetical protein